MVVQAPVQGPLIMVQTVFSHGELVASHANVRVREGARGGASHKRSINLPVARDDLAGLGAHLRWHGALSADAILTDAGPVYIDINPRLVEPANAWRSGVDLVGAMLEVACGQHPAQPEPGREGVATHQLLLAVLGAAQHHGTRRAVAREILDAAQHRRSYHGSIEELTPVGHDLRTIVPVVAATLATLVHPSTWRWFSSGAVASYALTPEGWNVIREYATPA